MVSDLAAGHWLWMLWIIEGGVSVLSLNWDLMSWQVKDLCHVHVRQAPVVWTGFDTEGVKLYLGGWYAEGHPRECQEFSGILHLNTGIFFNAFVYI